MLDKSVPYYRLAMHRKPMAPPPEPSLPDGYRLCRFQPGDEADWARIEAAVLEFDDPLEALLYFQRTYLPLGEELERRCLFIQEPSGRNIATATAWWAYTGEKRDPFLHWVAVHPEHQGKGLGYAVIAETIRLMTRIEGERDFYLRTQTWSHRAIRLYQRVGFEVSMERGLGGLENADAQQALEVLEEISLAGR